jgi:DNA-binding MarR family transcriptional regulator
MQERAPTGQHIAYLIGRLDRAVHASLQELLRPHGLSAGQYTALSVVQARPGLSNAQLARRSLITPQSMIEVVAGLEALGLVEREADPAHRRILRLRVTPAGAELLAAVDGPLGALEEEMLAGLSADAREALREGLAHCLRRLATEEAHGAAPA